MRGLAAHTVITQFIRWHLYCSLDLFKLSCIALPECIALPYVQTLLAYCARFCLVAFKGVYGWGYLIREVIPLADYSLCETVFPQVCCGKFLEKFQITYPLVLCMSDVFCTSSRGGSWRVIFSLRYRILNVSIISPFSLLCANFGYQLQSP